LICAQETGRPREEFFPITESAAGGFCADNLKTLGLSIGKDFVSPSGAIFSATLEIAGACEPMYEPTREIKEAVYDHFAVQMRQRRLTPSPNIQQMLREQLAGLAKSNRWLARALAQANRVSADMDLQAAARTAAVVETLDNIADSSVDSFLAARRAIVAGARSLRDLPAAERAQLERLRRRHTALVPAWDQGELSPLQLRQALVQYYRDRGRRALDERFFSPE
jgi:hypothetical protein